MDGASTRRAPLSFTVPRESDDSRLDVFLSRAVARLPRSAIQKSIREGRVSLDGLPQRRPSLHVFTGQEVSIVLLESTEGGLPVGKPIAITVVYEDDDLAVIDKPAGLVVHPGTGHDDDTLVNGILHLWPEIASVGDPARPGIVHRLDMDTSGLMLVAKSQAAFAALAKAVRERRVTRQYTLLVWGRVSPAEGVIDAPLARHPSRRRTQTIGAEGREARTVFRVLRWLPATTLVEATLETGRTHQIRVHFQAIGYPVVGDPTYGRPGFGLRRQFLHASRLAFSHPVTGQALEFQSPLPADLAEALEAAEKA